MEETTTEAEEEEDNNPGTNIRITKSSHARRQSHK
jgi:hypothetical protein